jgi:hypothetical protein
MREAFEFEILKASWLFSTIIHFGSLAPLTSRCNTIALLFAYKNFYTPF